MLKRILTRLGLTWPAPSHNKALPLGDKPFEASSTTSDPHPAKVKALAKTERAFYERLQTSDAAFLNGLTARSAGVFSVATATAALVGGSLVLGAAKALSGQTTWVKLGALGLALALLFFVGKAMWHALDAMRPGDFAQVEVVEDFIGLAWEQVGTDNPEADADRFLSEMTRQEVVEARKLIQPRFDTLDKAVDALKTAFVLALVLVSLATAITTFSADEKERSSEAAIPDSVSEAVSAKRSSSEANHPARAQAPNHPKGGVRAERDEIAARTPSTARHGATKETVGTKVTSGVRQ